MRVVLLVDNDLGFLETRAEFLTDAGYVVVTAATLEEAERVLRDGRVHLAIIDIRMVNNQDRQDVSGLTLAKKSEYRMIPKIILTDFPELETACESLRADLCGLPPAVDYVSKKEGAQALIQAVNRSFSRHIQINEGLVVQFGERELVGFPALALLLDPTLSDERLAHRAAELQDLFCMLFHGKTEIRIDRPLWKSEGRAALVVFAFAPGKCPQAHVVVCGRGGLVLGEAARYREFAPEAPGASGTVLVKTCETLHFAANVYALAGTNIENVYTLAECYREFPDRAFKAALEHLFKNTLAAWQLVKSIPDEEKSLATLYREELGCGGKDVTAAEIRRRIGAVTQQVPRLGVKIEEDSPNLTVRFGNRSYSYPDPVPHLFTKFPVGQSGLLVNAPGILTGRNLLADAEGRTWLTEFAQAGRKPLLWNYASLEAVVRFDWVGSCSLWKLHEMERALVDSAFDKIEPSAVDGQLRKPLRAIQEIRRLASRADGSAWGEYQLGLFYHAAHRLLAFNPARQLTDKELRKMAHVIMAQAMICGGLSLANGKSKSPPGSAPAGIRIEHSNRTVLVEGRRRHLSKTSYKVLRYLDMHRGELCTREDIAARALGDTHYDDENLAHQNRLNMCISRLRRVIENDPDNPRYLLNERGFGYRLVSETPDEN